MGLELRPLDVTSDREIDAVLALFRLAFGRDLSRAFYDWRFLENPFGPPMVNLLWDGDVLAGHYSVAPLPMFWDRECLVVQSGTTMTHPAYEGRGVFTTLASGLYERIAEHGVVAVWGMPNTKSHFGLTQRLGWRNVGIVPTMTHRLEAAAPKSQQAVAPVALGPDIDALYRDSLDGRIFASTRDTRYLDWRYRRGTDGPYRFFGLGGGRDAFAVVKEWKTADGRALEVVDYLYGKRPDAMGELTAGLIALAHEEGFASVRMWMDVEDPAFGHLDKLHFAPREPLTYFCVRPIGERVIAERDRMSSRWYLTMGNSDNF